MRRKGTVDELAQRRAKGLALLEQGKKMSEIAELLDTTPRTVSRWKRNASQPGS